MTIAQHIKPCPDPACHSSLCWFDRLVSGIGRGILQVAYRILGYLGIVGGALLYAIVAIYERVRR